MFPTCLFMRIGSLEVWKELDTTTPLTMERMTHAFHTRACLPMTGAVGRLCQLFLTPPHEASSRTKLSHCVLRPRVSFCLFLPPQPFPQASLRRLGLCGTPYCRTESSCHGMRPPVKGHKGWTGGNVSSLLRTWSLPEVRLSEKALKTFSLCGPLLWGVVEL